MSTNPIVIVTGGRDYSDRAALHRTLASLCPLHLVLGCARGADALARDWAKANRVGHTVLYADWATFGASAGMRRNKRMLSCALALAPAGQPPVLAQFPGGRGTANMVTLAASAGLRIVTAGTV